MLQYSIKQKCEIKFHGGFKKTRRCGAQNELTSIPPANRANLEEFECRQI